MLTPEQMKEKLKILGKAAAWEAVILFAQLVKWEEFGLFVRQLGLMRAGRAVNLDDFTTHEFSGWVDARKELEKSAVDLMKQMGYIEFSDPPRLIPDAEPIVKALEQRVKMMDQLQKRIAEQIRNYITQVELIKYKDDFNESQKERLQESALLAVRQLQDVYINNMFKTSSTLENAWSDKFRTQWGEDEARCVSEWFVTDVQLIMQAKCHLGGLRQFLAGKPEEIENSSLQEFLQKAAKKGNGKAVLQNFVEEFFINDCWNWVESRTRTRISIYTQDYEKATQPPPELPRVIQEAFASLPELSFEEPPGAVAQPIVLHPENGLPDVVIEDVLFDKRTGALDFHPNWEALDRAPYMMYINFIGLHAYHASDPLDHEIIEEDLKYLRCFIRWLRENGLMVWSDLSHKTTAIPLYIPVLSRRQALAARNWLRRTWGRIIYIDSIGMSWTGIPLCIGIGRTSEDARLDLTASYYRYEP